MTTPKTTASATCENGGSIDKDIDDIDAFYLRRILLNHFGAVSMHHILLQGYFGYYIS